MFATQPTGRSLSVKHEGQTYKPAISNYSWNILVAYTATLGLLNKRKPNPIANLFESTNVSPYERACY